MLKWLFITSVNDITHRKQQKSEKKMIILRNTPPKCRVLQKYHHLFLILLFFYVFIFLLHNSEDSFIWILWAMLQCVRQTAISVLSTGTASAMWASVHQERYTMGTLWPAKVCTVQCTRSKHSLCTRCWWIAYQLIAFICMLCCWL